MIFVKYNFVNHQNSGMNVSDDASNEWFSHLMRLDVNTAAQKRSEHHWCSSKDFKEGSSLHELN